MAWDCSVGAGGMALVSGNESGASAVLSHGVLGKWNSVCVALFVVGRVFCHKMKMG